MKSFRTDFSLKPEPFLAQDRPILTLGSCFAEHIGQRLLACKWQGLNSPLGALFHPVALSRLLVLAQRNAPLDDAYFVEAEGVFFHHDLHSRFHAADRPGLQTQWMHVAAKLRELLKEGPYVLLTLGTAWVYEWPESGRPVANCHKRPADHFVKRLLGAEEIQAALTQILDILPPASPVFLSLSPVRHTRDTMVLNSLSKSMLLVQIHEFVRRHPERVRYFPAYEIMLDDLRDYRFYASDMIHPSPEAIDYIWEKFISCYATPATKDFLRRWQPVLAALEHRPQRAAAPSYQKHLLQILRDLDSFPGLDCAEEKAVISARITNS